MMQQRFRILSFLMGIGITLLSGSCLDSDALRGRISLALTDAPIDATTIREVNIAIRKIDVLPEGSQQWQTIKSFEEPRTINLLEFTQGKAYDLTVQFLTPGKYEAIRLELNIANVSNGLTVFPQSNIVFTNGSQETLFVDGTTNYVETTSDFAIATNQTTFLTLDFDLRKSIVLTQTGYKLRPAMRLVSTETCGGIDGQFRDFANFTKVAVYVYNRNAFNTSEASGEQPFANAVSSASVRSSFGGRFYLSFLPEGPYDLVFVELNENGSMNQLLGRYPLPEDQEVVRGEDTFISVFADDLQ